jgi:hypothetical protein
MIPSRRPGSAFSIFPSISPFSSIDEMAQKTPSLFSSRRRPFPKDFPSFHRLILFFLAANVAELFYLS